MKEKKKLNINVFLVKLTVKNTEVSPNFLVWKFC